MRRDNFAYWGAAIGVPIFFVWTVDGATLLEKPGEDSWRRILGEKPVVGLADGRRYARGRNIRQRFGVGRPFWGGESCVKGRKSSNR